MDAARVAVRLARESGYCGNAASGCKDRGHESHVDGQLESYFNQRVFGVPRLRFTATATLASQQFDSRLSGNIDARRENVSKLFESRFDYSIGRLETRVSARSAVIEGRTDHLIFFRMSRRFGLF